MSFLHIESSVIHDLKALMKDIISSSYTDELWAIYENIMTGSRFVLKFSFLHNFVNFVCTDMYDIPLNIAVSKGFLLPIYT